MKYIPKITPAPVTAVRLSKDLHASAGSYLVVHDSGKVEVMPPDRFQANYAPENPRRAPRTRARSWDAPESQVMQLASLVPRGERGIDRDDLHRLFLRRFPTWHFAARLADAMRHGILAVNPAGVVRHALPKKETDK